jgi:hypothetical protein
MVVRLSASRAGRPLPPGRSLVFISVEGWIDPRAIVWLEGVGHCDEFGFFFLGTVDMYFQFIIAFVWCRHEGFACNTSVSFSFLPALKEGFFLSSLLNSHFLFGVLLVK